MRHSIKTFSLAFAAIAVLATTPAIAVEDDFGNDAPLSRQIVVQEADQKDEVKQLVAKLRKSRDEANKKTETQTAEIVEDNIVENKVVEATPEIVDEELFAPKTKVKIVEVEMPTIFDDNQIALYNDLTNAQQASLVKKLIKKYGYNMLYPTKRVNTYHSKYRSNGSYNHKSYKTYGHNTGYRNHSTGYSRKNYTRSYSNSGYHAKKGCSK